MIAQVYVKFYDPCWREDNWHWKHLCTVFDNEALGVLERALDQAGVEHKVQDTELPCPRKS